MSNCKKIYKVHHLYLNPFKKIESPIKKMGEGHIQATEICHKMGH